MRVGVDLAKRVIQVHAVDAAGRRVAGRALKREQFMAWCAQLPAGCLVAMEACSSAHHWARKLRALGLDARLIAANFVTPVPHGGQERQERHERRGGDLRGGLTPEHALRAGEDLRAARRDERAPACARGSRKSAPPASTASAALLAEFGLVFAQSPKVLRTVLADVLEDASNELSALARLVLQRAFDHWRELDEHMRWCDSAGGPARALEPGGTARRKDHRHRRARRLGADRQRGRLPAVQERRISSAPGWGSFPARTPAAARRVWGGSPSAATTTFERCSSRVPSPP